MSLKQAFQFRRCPTWQRGRKAKIEQDLGADQHNIKKQIGKQKCGERAVGYQEPRGALKKGIARASYRAVVAQVRLDLAPDALPQAAAYALGKAAGRRAIPPIDKRTHSKERHAATEEDHQQNEPVCRSQEYT